MFVLSPRSRSHLTWGARVELEKYANFIILLRQELQLNGSDEKFMNIYILFQKFLLKQEMFTNWRNGIKRNWVRT